MRWRTVNQQNQHANYFIHYTSHISFTYVYNIQIINNCNLNSITLHIHMHRTDCKFYCYGNWYKCHAKLIIKQKTKIIRAKKNNLYINTQ